MAGKNERGLQVTLPSDREIVMTRLFAAPRHLVFAAFTRPELVRRWWCCMEGFTMTTCDIDLRVGGRYRYAMVGPDGVEHAFYGEFREIVPDVRFVHTEIYGLHPDVESLITESFEDRAGQTFYSSLCIYPSQEVRDAVLQSGMEVGVAIGFDRLEEVAQELAAGAAPR